MKPSIKKYERWGLALGGWWIFNGVAYAQAALPWEGPLQTMQNSLTGPVAKAIGIIALAVSGGMLAFGGELSDFTKRIIRRYPPVYGPACHHVTDRVPGLRELALKLFRQVGLQGLVVEVGGVGVADQAAGG